MRAPRSQDSSASGRFYVKSDSESSTLTKCHDSNLLMTSVIDRQFDSVLSKLFPTKARTSRLYNLRRLISARKTMTSTRLFRMLLWRQYDNGNPAIFRTAGKRGIVRYWLVLPHAVDSDVSAPDPCLTQGIGHCIGTQGGEFMVVCIRT